MRLPTACFELKDIIFDQKWSMANLILDDDHDFRVHSEADIKKIKNLKVELIEIESRLHQGRLMLYIYLALQVAVYLFYMLTNVVSSLEGLIEVAILMLVFLIPAFVSYKKPIVGFILAAALWLLLQLLYTIGDPTNIVKGFLIKGIFIYYTYRAIVAAYDKKKIMQEFAKYGISQ